MIFEIRLHGIGGQGVAASADLLALAAVRAGMWAHSFPFFGTEIRGGNVTAFTRISPDPIRDRSFIYYPHLIVVFSAHLLSEDTWKGAREESVILVNTSRSIKDLPTPPKGRLIVLDADRIADELPRCRMGNSVLLGAMLTFIPAMQLSSLEAAFLDKFSSESAQGNIAGAREGYQRLKAVEKVV